MVIETERLYLRKLTEDDYDNLCGILQDEEVMYAYEHAFSDSEVHEWLQRQLNRYIEYGNFGLWAVILKETGEFIGQTGLTIQECGGNKYLEIGYLFKKAFWHRGFATEAAIACREYAFNVLGADSVYSIIRDSNTASQNVAKRVGMHKIKEIVKHYHNIDMPHYIYAINKK